MLQPLTAQQNKRPVAEKSGLHPRSKHRGQYDFEQLIQANTKLAEFVTLNDYNEASIDFANPQAVKTLNQALLKHFYNISDWNIPEKYLCPPIPGRADYLHYIADLLSTVNGGVIPYGRHIRVLDIGVGANGIYPLIGQREYGWQFIGTDIDPTAIVNAQKTVNANIGLSEVIKLRLQTSFTNIFTGIVQKNEAFDISMCNPPFHRSLQEAQAGSARKWQNLNKNTGKNQGKNQSKNKEKNEPILLNFGGQNGELHFEGGEDAFVNRMIKESQIFKSQCLWFTTLISKATTLPGVYRALKNANAVTVKTIDMSQGQKKSRIVAWTFLNATQQKHWRNKHWSIK